MSTVLAGDMLYTHGGRRMHTQDFPVGTLAAGHPPATGAGGQAQAETLEQVLGSMVHAIANSLNSVMAASQLANLLLAQDRMVEARVSLDRVETECSRSARLLREGRNLATLNVPPSIGGVDVETLLAACAAACSDLGDVRVRRDGEARLPLACGQADALKRLFVEILDNAFQFGAHNVEIAVRVDVPQRAVAIEFRDDGPGLQIHSPAVFESFSSSEPAEHSGLGLAFAARIAAAYGGAIGLGEAGEQGAMFWVRLPFAEVDSAH